MKRKTRLAAIFLSIILTIGLFGACSNGQKNGAVSSNLSIDKNLTSEKKDPSAFDLPIVKTPLKLTWFSKLDAKVAASQKSYDEIGCFKVIQEKTGIDIEFQHPPIGQETEQFNLMLASRSYPDIIFWEWPLLPGGPAKVIDDKEIIPLNDLINKYAPHYKKYLDENNDARKQVSLDDKTIYLFGSLNIDPRVRVTAGFQIRQDWLDRLGLKSPVTIDDWYKVLTEFKNKDANGNGDPNDEIPFLSSKSANFKSFSAAWGVYSGFFQDKGKVKYGPAEKEYKDFVTEMAKWYKEGLIDSEYGVVDSKMLDAKMTGDLGGSYWGAISGGLGRYMNLMVGKNNKVSLIGVSSPVGTAGKPYTTNLSGSYIVNVGAAITSSNKHLEETAKLMDYFYTDEANQLTSWGVEGQSYTIENGKKKMTDMIMKNPNGLSIDQALARYAYPHFAGGPNITSYDAREPIVLGLPQQKIAFDTWSKDDRSLLLPPLNPSGDDGAKYVKIVNDINTYYDEMLTKFVMGKESLDKYDDFVKNLKNMGLDDAVKIMQSTLDKYNVR